MILTLIVNDSPYGIEKPWNALRLASASASDGVEVRLFLMGDSVSSGKKGQKTPDGYYNMEMMLRALIKKGVTIKACGTCLNARGLDVSEIVDGVERGSMKILSKWVKNSDQVISF